MADAVFRTEVGFQPEPTYLFGRPEWLFVTVNGFRVQQEPLSQSDWNLVPLELRSNPMGCGDKQASPFLKGLLMTVRKMDETRRIIMGLNRGSQFSQCDSLNCRFVLNLN